MVVFPAVYLILAIIPVVLYVLVLEYKRVTEKFSLEKRIIESNYSTFYGDSDLQSYNLENATDIEVAKSTRSLATSNELNPVRLGMIKILSTHNQYQQSEMRKHLGVSWGKFT